MHWLYRKIHRGSKCKVRPPHLCSGQREYVSDPVKGKIVENFKSLGVTLLHVRASISACMPVFVFCVLPVGGYIGKFALLVRESTMV
jgi:hypothetical protein